MNNWFKPYDSFHIPNKSYSFASVIFTCTNEPIGRGRGAGVSDDHHVGQGRRPGGGVYDRSRADPRALRPRGRAGHRRRHRRQRPHDGRGPDGRRAGDTARRQG